MDQTISNPKRQRSIKLSAIRNLIVQPPVEMAAIDEEDEAEETDTVMYGISEDFANMSGEQLMTLECLLATAKSKS